MYTAQEVIKDKFWIVNTEHGKVGTLRNLGAGNYEFFDQRSNETTTLDSLDQLFVLTEKSTGTPEVLPEVMINGYSTGLQEAYQQEYKHYPAYTKTANANTLYGAGYYIIEFHSTGWQWAFNPKISTLEKYPSKGPYQTEWEANLELKKHRRTS